MDKERREGYFVYKFKPGEEELRKRAIREGIDVQTLIGGDKGTWISIRRFPDEWQKLERLATDMGFPVKEVLPRVKS